MSSLLMEKQCFIIYVAFIYLLWSEQIQEVTDYNLKILDCLNPNHWLLVYYNLIYFIFKKEDGFRIIIIHTAPILNVEELLLKK